MNNKQFMYYSRLCKLGTKQHIFITLHEVAEAMFTSMRHSRTLLKEMVQSGWLIWKPKVGRNQRSTLFLQYSEDELRTEIAKELIKKGKYEKALAMVESEQARFEQLLRSTSGSSWREDRLHIQLTYQRSFLPLLPHKPLRNAERFLVRQIYACLTSCDAQGNVSAQLAHHWSYDAQRYIWRFYLRPQLRFHSGELIDASAVCELFSQLQQFPRYKDELAHITSISAPHPLCVEFQLSDADLGFSGLVADIRYSIQPASQLLSAPHINGSGIFQVQEFSKQCLQLQAYDNFYATRSLTDTVSIWQVSSQSERTFGATSIQADMASSAPICSNHVYEHEDDKSVEGAQQTRIEDGCLLTFINSATQLSLLQRKYLTLLLTSKTLMAQVSRSNKINATPAANLLPYWVNAVGIETDTEPQYLPHRLSIAIYDHLALEECAKAIVRLLEKEHIECDIHVYPYALFYHKACQGELTEDLILSSLNLDDNRPSSAYSWMLSDPILHQSLSPKVTLWLQQRLTQIRQHKPLTEYLDEIEHLATALINEHWLLPMFHHRQVLHFEGELKGISMNVWGWPDFQYVWSENQL